MKEYIKCEICGKTLGEADNEEDVLNLYQMVSLLKDGFLRGKDQLIPDSKIEWLGVICEPSCKEKEN